MASASNLYGPYGASYLAIPHGGHNNLFEDKNGQWWSTFFGNDSGSPIYQQPAILPIESSQGLIQPDLTYASTATWNGTTDGQWSTGTNSSARLRRHAPVGPLQ